MGRLTLSLGHAVIYERSCVEKVISSKPSWETCIFLHNEIKNEKYGRLLGGISSAIRNGSEITHEDWGNDWAELAVQCLPSCSGIMLMFNATNFIKYDKWLQDNESTIIRELHMLFSSLYREMA